MGAMWFLVVYDLKQVIRKNYPYLLLFLILVSCNEKGADPSLEVANESEFISAVDISRYPEISLENPSFFNSEGVQEDFLTILNRSGVNTVRLKLWVNPENKHSGFEEVLSFSNELKSLGFKIWLTIHYSDTWADPGNQTMPKDWEDLEPDALQDSVYDYTKRVVTQMRPDFIQIGNEINSGFLHPIGNIINENQQFIALLTSGVEAVREHSDAKIVLHFAGLKGSDWFFEQLKDVDYDLIGLSFYPIWHGKSLNQLATTMNQLSEKFDKQILIAETAYPFTLNWNDWTNNIVGLEEQLILPDFPATPEGQKQFIKSIKELIKDVDQGMGFCYWGAELIAWKGSESENASPWENQALFDFDHKALPVLDEFRME
jgi:arabinogalactan endo-1,4-beta-galactosidase